MPRGHPGPTANPLASGYKPEENRKLKPRGKPFEKGNRNGGRPKGSPNKINQRPQGGVPDGGQSRRR